MTTHGEEKIGIFGGTFNPVHIGHLVVAQNALEQYELSRVIFVPAANPPHKKAAELAPATHRVAMLEAAIESDPRFEISDIEIQRQGPSYTVDTLTHFKATYPESKLYFIVGSDTLHELHAWKEIRKVLSLAVFVTFARPGFELNSLNAAGLKLDNSQVETLKKNTTTLHMIDISASEVRYRVAEGMSIRYLVPHAVESYITEHHLYGK